MASVIATGNTATINFAAAATFSVTKITPRGRERGKVETSHLGTLVHKKQEPGGLIEPGGFDVDYIFDADTSLATGVAAKITAAAEEITLTFPKGANTTAATLSGKGHVDSETPPEITNDDLMVGSFGIQFEGGAADEPAYASAI